MRLRQGARDSLSAMIRRAGGLQAFEVGDQIVPLLIAKEKADTTA